MASRGRNRKSTQQRADGSQTPSGSTSTGLPQASTSSRAAMDEAVLRRAEKRKARAAEKAAGLEAEKNAGNDLFKAGDYKGAVAVYRAAISEFGEKPVLMSNLTATYLKLGMYEEAEEAATTVLMYDPLMIKARYRRGMARKGMYHFKAAMADFESVLQQDPGRTEAQEQLKSTQELYDMIGDDEDSENEDSESSDDDWPHYHSDAPEEESEAESDSSDCQHSGNGFPCRFYNHEGCSRKDTCRYSHAPDNKSQRDKLGRNVCLYFLLGKCNFGTAKCVYSHDKTYLPPGWWDHADIVAELNEIFSYADIEAGGGKHALREFLAASRSETSSLNGLTTGERVAGSGSAEKVVAGTGTPASTGKQEPVALASSGQRFVLLMVLDGDTTADYKQPTFTALKAKLPMKKAESPSEALAHLASPALVGVFVADAALSERKHSQVLSKLVEYARSGGSVVLGGSFSSFVSPPKLATFFANSWGVNWKSGSYHRATFSLNTSHDLAKSNSDLPTSYSMKALHVQGISPGVAIYKESGANPSESPAVQIRFGKGYMGYIGDVNWEEGSIVLLLAMLRLSDPPSIPSPMISSNAAPRATSAINATNRTAAPAVNVSEAGPSTPSVSAQMRGHGASSSSSQLFVLLLALGGDMVEAYKQPTLASIKAKGPVKTAFSTADALTHIASPGLKGVFITDAAIIKPQHSQVLTKLVEYAKAGGSVLIGGSFSSFVKPNDLSIFFEKSWGVNWKSGSYHRTTFFLNPTHELAKTNPSLLSSYSMKALHIKDVPSDVMIYRPTQGSRLQSLAFPLKAVSDFNESPAIQTRIGKGRLGYIGDVNWEEGSAKLILAMLGLLDTPPPQPQATPTTSFTSVPPTPKKPTQTSPAAPGPGLKPATSTQKSVPVDTKSKQPASTAATKPFVMLLSLDNEDFFATSHAHCLSALRDKVETVEALTAPSALTKLDSANLTGVFVTDAGIVKAENAHVLSRLVEYVKSGGSVVVGGLFSTFVSGGEMAAFFKNAWGLPWKEGSYHLTRFSLNPSHEIVTKHPSLATSYSMKALHVGGISARDVVYLPADDSQIHRMIPAPIDITEFSESPAVQRQIGSGHLGYIGDVDAETETTNVLLAMLGLLDPPSNAKDVKPTHVKVSESSVEVPMPRVDVPDKQKSIPVGPTSRPFMMVLSFGNEKFFAGVQGDLLDLLRSKLEVLHGLSNERVIELIGSPDLVGILVTDAAVANAENAYLLGKLVAFTKGGGTVVMGGLFGSHIKFDDMGPFFQDNWSVPWSGGDYTRSDITVNNTHELVKKNPGMPPAFCMKALHINGVTPETAVYLLANGSRASAKKVQQVPVALARVGKGHLGYIGDVGLQDEHSKIVLAMFGLK